MKDELDSLLQKKMDRRDFLKHVGVGFAAITGIAAVVKTMNSLGGKSKAKAAGYCSSTYGSKKKSTGYSFTS
jgi:hypothetical protein